MQATLGPAILERTAVVAETLTNAGQPGATAIARIQADFLARIEKFREQFGRWPRSWGDFRFTDLGLNPDDWSGPVEGIFWNPHGSEIGLGNKAGDKLQVYVKDLNGNLLHLHDGWNIWCRGGGCYYHTVAPGNEVDISTLVVVEEP